MYTADLSKHIDHIPCTFIPAMMQKKIKKEFELRIFYLDEQFYCMAIMSQLDAQTKDDFRRYNKESPNRWLPFQLPIEIKEKLIKLMNTMQLNTGSIDMIYNKDDGYVFLEVNPTGQFGMVSKTCNFPIEKKVAEYLIQLTK